MNKFSIVHKYKNLTMYQLTNGQITLPFEISRFKDKTGTLLRVDSSFTGMFERYSFKEVKQIMIAQLDNYSLNSVIEDESLKS